LTELTEVKGIGAVTAQKLKERGIASAEQLATMSPDLLSKIIGVSRVKAHEIIEDAKEKTLGSIVELRTAEEVLAYRENVVQRISTGSKDLDRILGGGVETDCITAFVGQAASGKTQILHQLSLNCIRQLDRDVVYIETEPNTFSPQRIKEMGGGDVLNRILVIPSRVVESDPHKLRLCYDRIAEVIEGGRDIALIAIDSFIAPFRAYYHGREMLPERRDELASHLGMLQKIASKHNVAVVLSSQVGGVPDESAQIEAKKRFGIPRSITGGEYYLHSFSVGVSLEYYGRDIWRACLFDSSYLPRATAYFKITSKGIEDLTESERKAVKEE
jgi:DNA repair protein RadA